MRASLDAPRARTKARAALLLSRWDRRARRALPALVLAQDRAAPAAGGLAALLQEALEVRKLPLDLLRHARLRRSRIDVHLEHEPRLVVADAVKGHDAAVARAPDGLPGDALVRDLLADLPLRGDDLVTELRAPADMGVVDLLGLPQDGHVAREVEELRELVVGGARGDLEV